MSTLLFGLLALPVYLLMLWPLVVASRRVLGVRIGTVRALLGAIVGWLVAGRVLGWLLPTFHESPGLYGGLLIPIAGCAFLATLTFLFVGEMAFPSGGGLGFVGRLRSIRRRGAHVRRYSQVSKIAVKHGIGQYLVCRRGTDGTRHAVLARSLRRALEDAGVTFVKLGQVLSTRPDLLPPAFIDRVVDRDLDIVYRVARSLELRASGHGRWVSSTWPTDSRKRSPRSSTSGWRHATSPR